MNVTLFTTRQNNVIYNVSVSKTYNRWEKITAFFKRHVSIGIRKIVPEKNCPPVRVRVSFRISVGIRAGGAIFLEPFQSYFDLFQVK